MIEIKIGNDTYRIEMVASCAVVSREGNNPFKQGYEDSEEAAAFFGRLIFAAKLREIESSEVAGKQEPEHGPATS